MVWSVIIETFQWLPGPIKIMFIGLVVIYVIYAIMKLIKLILDVIPFA
jgi:xanthosine utilization system XapX-like protein